VKPLNEPSLSFAFAATSFNFEPKTSSAPVSVLTFMLRPSVCSGIGDVEFGAALNKPTKLVEQRWLPPDGNGFIALHLEIKRMMEQHFYSVIVFGLGAFDEGQ